MTRSERLGLELGISEQTGASPTDRETAHSIAISLKRIADALEQPMPMTGAANLLPREIEFQTFSKGQP